MTFTLDQIGVLTERTTLFLFILNKEGKIINCNAKCRGIFNPLVNGSEKTLVYDCVIDEDTEEFKHLLLTLSEQNPITKHTFRFPAQPEGILSLKLEFIFENNFIYATGIETTEENKEHRALQVISKLTKTGAWYFNPKNGKMHWSEGCYRVKDLDPNTPITRDLGASFYPEASRPRVEKYLDTLIKSKQPYTYTEKIITAKGVEKWVKVKAHPVIYKNEVIFVNGTIADITDRYKYVEKLKYNEETKRLALKGIRSGLFDHHIPENVVFYSEDLKKMIGLPLDKDFIPEKEFTKLIHPYDLDKSLQRHFDNLKDQNPYYFNHYRLFHREEGYRYYEVYGFKTFNSGGKAIRLIGNLIDVNEKTENERLIKESKKHLHAMINNSFAYILLLNTNGQILMADDFTLKIIKKDYGIDPIESKSLFIDVMPLNFKNTFVHEFNEALKGNHVKKEIERKTTEGHTQWLESKYTPIYNEENNIISVLVSFHDITETKRAELTVKEAHIREQELSRLKTNILSNFSHEIRTPLNGIMTITKLLLKEQNKQERDKLLNLLKESEDRLLYTLDNLSNFSELEVIKNNLDLMDIDINALVEACYKEHKHLVDSKSLKYNLILERDSPYCKLDKELFKISLGHIIQNAIKYTDSGKIEIKVESDKNNVYISVLDTGIGIKEENLKEIFEPFVQESIGLSRKYEGTGIGLSLAKRYVEILGGNIITKSKSGEGTEFIIIIPISL